MPNNIRTAEKILSNLKGLRNHLQPDEQPLMNIPAIWDGTRSEQGGVERAMPCDVVLTNQRVLGYAFVSFPRERLFLDELALSAITNVSLRQKTYEPIFRELLISDGQRRVYIRAPRRKIEVLYEALRSTIEQYAPNAFDVSNTEPARPAPVYGRQDIRASFERSPLAITLLFVGGLILEITGVIAWSATHSSQIGFPLCVAGFVAVFTAIVVKRRSS